MFNRPRFPILRVVVLFIPLHALASALQLMFVTASLGLMLALLLAAQGVSGQGEPPPSAAAEFVAPPEIVLLPPTPIAAAGVIVVETEVAAGIIETPFPQSTDTPPPPATDAPVLAATATETPAATVTETPQPTATETPVLTVTATETTATATETPQPTATQAPALADTATETPVLTATATETTAATATETAQPTGTQTPALADTATETPRPPATETPALTATATETPLATMLASATPTATTAGPNATPTDTPSPALPAPPLPTVAPTRTPGASFWPLVLLTEFLADPTAVADSAGEWVELYNPNQEPVNLAGWNLADADGERHTIVSELWLPSGAYLVMGRNADRAVNGGAPVEYVYRGFTLANSADEIFLFAPNGVETDRVVWGDNGGLAVTPGSSLERTDWTPAAAWATARSPWPGSAGDNGSPRGPYRPPDLPTATETATVTWLPAATSSPTGTGNIEFIASATPTAPAPVLPSPTDTPWPTTTATTASTTTATATAPAPVLPSPTDTPWPTTTATAASTTTATATAPAPVLPSPTDTPWPTAIATAAVAVTGTSTASPTAPATWAPTTTATATAAATLEPPSSTSQPTLSAEPSTSTPAALTPTSLPRLLITEFLADPKAVADNAGEWVELHNPNPAPVNLLGWSLADADGERHTIAADLWLDAGAYLVLGRNGDRTMNGGAPVRYVYSGFTLANSADELILLAPDGALVDELTWGATGGLTVTPGASLERTTLDTPATWTTATSPWPDSAGDFGSPGAPYAGPGCPHADCHVPADSNDDGCAHGNGNSTEPALCCQQRRPWRTTTAMVEATTTATATEPAPGLPTATDTPWPAATATTAATATGTSAASPTAPATSAPTSTRITHTDRRAAHATGADAYPCTAPAHHRIPGGPQGRGRQRRRVGGIAQPQPRAGEPVGLEPGRRGRRASHHRRRPLAGCRRLPGARAERRPHKNGGAPVRYVYSGFTLANSADELILLAPDGALVDELAWGAAGGLTVTPGASLERTTMDSPATWTTATSPWPDSAGDFGSPGAPYAGLAVPTATATGGSILPTPTEHALADGNSSGHVHSDGNSHRCGNADPAHQHPAAHGDRHAAHLRTAPAHHRVPGRPQGRGRQCRRVGGAAQPQPAPVNLLGWSLADGDGERHTIAADLWLDRRRLPGARAERRSHAEWRCAGALRLQRLHPRQQRGRNHPAGA